MEVKLGSKTGLDTVQNEKHVEVEVASPDDSNQAPLVRVTLAASRILAGSRILIKFPALFATEINYG